MKFAVPYYNKTWGESWIEKADEIIIKYNGEDKESIVAFLEKYSDKRVIIYVEEYAAFLKIDDKFLIFNEYLPHKKNLTNWAICFHIPYPQVINYVLDKWIDDSNVYQTELQSDFRPSIFVDFQCETYEELDMLLFRGVSDIYITNSLAFDVVQVRKNLEKNTARFGRRTSLRLFPNICQSYWADEKAIRSFFIRPEDIKMYEPYVDVMEIYALTSEQKEKAEVYLDIYKKGHWIGDLSEFLINCNEKINNTYLFSDFTSKRMSCGKRCVRTYSCNYCLEILECIRLKNQIDSRLEDVPNSETKTTDENIKDYIGEF